MELSGQAKIDFENWYVIIYCEIEQPSFTDSFKRKICDRFYEDRLSEQWGVYVDWSDDIGMFLNDWINNNGCFSSVHGETTYNKRGVIKGRTRSEVRIGAINKLSEIYNKKFRLIKK